jgi:aminomethyltransferase
MGPTELKKTPLNAEHRALKGRMVDFGGWDLPVQYTTVVDEHKTVRTAVGLFDVSHMGEVLVEGPKALEFLNSITTNNIAKMVDGQAQYNAMCYENGTLVDDIIVYRRNAESYFVVVNASNTDKDFEWMKKHLPASGVKIENQSAQWGQIAVQGPKARALVQELVNIPLEGMKFYTFAEGQTCGIPSIIARTGYTGELGFELYVPAKDAPKVWTALLEAGQKYGVKPIGLGARDTLRLEVGYLLYGNDMDNTTTAQECGLDWVTRFDKGNFIGRDVLLNQKEKGLTRQLVGFEMIDKAIGRHGYPIFASQEGGEACGTVTSGTMGPSISVNFGMAYVPSHLATDNSTIWVEVRGERKQAKIVSRPFYKQGTARIK